MRKTTCGFITTVGIVLTAAAFVVAQPPGGQRGPGRGGNLSTDEFVKQAMSFDADKDGQLDQEELVQLAKELARQGPPGRGPGGRGGPPGGRGGPPGGGPPGGGGPGGREMSFADLGPDPLANKKMGPELKTYEPLEVFGDSDLPFVVQGDVQQGLLGDSREEHNGGGLRFFSGDDRDDDGSIAGEATCKLSGFDKVDGQWYRLRLTGLAQDDFAVGEGELYLKVEYFKDGGKNALDFIRKSLIPQVERDRKAFDVNFQAEKLGDALWRNYSIEFRAPFAEIDTMQVSIGFNNGEGKGDKSEFWVREVELRPIPAPADYVPPKTGGSAEPIALKSLVSLGGRWYYDPRGGDRSPPKQFDSSNADQLYYFSGRLETPFAGNMSAWLQPNYVDRTGKKVEQKRLIDDSVVITFTGEHLVMKSQNIPNHPVAVFPDLTGFQGGNPGVIRELNQTWYLPLEPKPNPNRGEPLSMQNKNALPMGPIGVAVNGVVFYNPFDGPGMDASLLMDRCCGHTGPTSQYHYHKYPVCVNTPWADDGTDHSPLIGFAFDGFPVYGPYEKEGVMAKDLQENPLNAFSLHEDAERGPHYHVTPGQFPHMIGGYWGVVESKNRSRGGSGPRRR